MLIGIFLVLFLPFLRSLVVAHELNKEEAPLLRWPQENPEFLQLGENIPEKNNPRTVQTVFSGLPPAARLVFWFATSREDWGVCLVGLGLLFKRRVHP